jgi:predicted transcriptional regulator
MGQPGREAETTDLEILRVGLLVPEPFFTSSDVAEEIEMSQQGAHYRLTQLQDDGLIESKKAGNARAWWLTYEGKKFVADELLDSRGD